MHYQRLTFCEYTQVYPPHHQLLPMARFSYFAAAIAFLYRLGDDVACALATLTMSSCSYCMSHRLRTLWAAIESKTDCAGCQGAGIGPNSWSLSIPSLSSASEVTAIQACPESSFLKTPPNFVPYLASWSGCNRDCNIPRQRRRPLAAAPPSPRGRRGDALHQGPHLHLRLGLEMLLRIPGKILEEGLLQGLHRSMNIVALHL